MKSGQFFKNLTMLALAFTIMVSAIFFGTHESAVFSKYLDYDISSELSNQNMPLAPQSSYYSNQSNYHLLTAAEIKDVSVLNEVIKKLERVSINKRIVILTMILSFFLSIGIVANSFLPSIFPWTTVICSRNSIISYIHNQDGLK